MPDEEVLQRAFKRERAARREAENLLEDKSRQLFYANQELTDMANSLRKESSKARAILEKAADGIISFSDDGSIESVNPAAEALFQYSEDDLRSVKIHEIISPILDDELANEKELEFWRLEKVAVAESQPALGRRKDSTIFQVEYSASRAEHDEGYLHTWFVRDVTKRQEIERQLAFSQKMESVGQLAAGIAHEINTPIQYLGDNAEFLAEAFDDLNDLLELLIKLHSNACFENPNDPLIQQISEKSDEIDVSFLRKEVPAAITQSSEGTNRVAKIVQAMKEFSHPGAHEKTLVDINQAIESTVTVSRNEWKFVADIELDLAPESPKVPCLPGELNQAVLNIVINASHAIRDTVEDGEKGVIRISTRSTESGVEIRISDTGPGIPADVRKKMFEPFFTTKDVGQGTGQGLSVVHAVIVEKHAGEIDVETEIGKGTTFTLKIPMSLANQTRTT